MSRTRKDRHDRLIGVIVMSVSLLSGLFYYYSLYLWLSVYAKGELAWTWWIVISPLALIVFFLVFFTTWIGWVMVKPKPRSIDEFIKEQEKKAKELREFFSETKT